MTSSPRTSLIALLALLATGIAQADEERVFSGQRIGPVAELSPEERTWFRQQWNQLPPGERESLRQKLRDNGRDLPPEERQGRRREIIERMREQTDAPPPRPPQPDWATPDDGYGQGYGTRRDPREWDDAPRRRR